ncbi:MAG TPA: ATP-binding protein [Blastocatellia bacterium]|nr:ATP-binding protein [Blastocatellia bacterium]
MREETKSLRAKIFLYFGALLMLSLLMAGLIIALLRGSASSSGQTLRTDRQVAELILIIKAERLRIDGSLRGHLLRPHGEFGDQELKNINAAYEQINPYFVLARELMTDQDLLDTLDDIRNTNEEELRSLERQILDAIGKQKPAEAEQLYFGQYLEAHGKQQWRLRQLYDLVAYKISSSLKNIESQLEFIDVITIPLILVLIIVGCLLSYRLTCSIDRPIERLTWVARAIAAGDGLQRLTLNRKDKFGELAEALNLMVNNLREINEDRVNNARRLDKTKNELEQTQTQMVMREQLLQQEKMAALGRMVAGVAHELNNPISFVYSNTVLLNESITQLRRLLDFYDGCEEMPEQVKQGAYLLKEEIDYDYLVADISNALQDCHEGSSRVRDIVLNLKTFSRADELEWQAVDITAGIESTIRMLGQFFRPERVVIHRDYAELPKIECYAGQLSQVWMNLMVNAAQAMNSQGDLWITTQLDGDWAVVLFRDNGPGIPEDVVTKIFDPFFTTKSVGEGTGLGLSIVHGIIERHGGDIKVESRIGEGALFTIKLPLAKRGSPDNISEEPEGLVEKVCL